MTYTRAGSFYQVRLHKGEDVVEELKEFVRRRQVGSGVVTGIGAADAVELGLFDPERREYVKRRY
ncbi:DNA-binding protein, partial [candidate division WOR-3 bacterium]|nr:DNA-binding protein [candidate division WOR-3 bacterium]